VDRLASEGAIDSTPKNYYAPVVTTTLTS
jgi:hypothetical protein